MVINYHRNVKSWPKELNSGEILVEKAGYVPAKARIESIIDAGKRLVDFRMEQFDSYQPHFDEEDFFDPTRSPNFDLVDAQRYAEGIKQRAEKARMDAEEAKKKSLQLKEKAESDEKKAEDKAKKIESKNDIAQLLLSKLLG